MGVPLPGEGCSGHGRSGSNYTQMKTELGKIFLSTKDSFNPDKFYSNFNLVI